MSIQTDVVDCEAQVVACSRALIDSSEFKVRHRTNDRAFERQRQLPFGRVMLLILQKTLRSVQLHLNDFFQHLFGDQGALGPTASAWTQARAKLRHTAFIELNERAVLDPVYGGGTDFVVKRWRGWRVLAIDGSLAYLPNEEALGQEFGWVECSNQSGACGRYVQGRLSSLYDVLNEIALEVVLVNWHVGEREVGWRHLARLQAQDLLLLDRGYASYRWFAWLISAQRQFVCRCEANSFKVVRQLVAENVAGRSLVVKLRPHQRQEAAIKAEGLPEEIEVRFVTLRLPSGELEVLATSLLDEECYPTECFYQLYGLRWGVETFYDVIKGRLALEHFTGRTVEAVRQEVHATVYLSNLETVVARRAQKRLDQVSQQRQLPLQVNRAVAFHAIKSHVISLLMSRQPVGEVLDQLEELFMQKPVGVRQDNNRPRRKVSGWLAYKYQRYRRKTVF